MEMCYRQPAQGFRHIILLTNEFSIANKRLKRFWEKPLQANALAQRQAPRKIAERSSSRRSRIGMCEVVGTMTGPAFEQGFNFSIVYQSSRISV